MEMRDLTIGKKVFGGFGAVIVLLLIIGAFNYFGVKSIVDNGHEVIHGNELDAELAQREVDHLNWAGMVCAYLVDTNISDLRVEADPRNCGFGKWYYGEGRRQAERMVPSLAPLLQRIEKPHSELHASAIAIRQAGGDSEGRLRANAIFVERSKPALAGVQGLLHEIRAEARKSIMTDTVMMDAANKTLLAISAAAAITVAVALLMAFLTSRGITMILTGIARQMSDGSSQVAAAAAEVSSASQSLAEGASEQASSLEETSASLEEVAAMTKQDAENAGQADRVMKNAAEVVSSADASMQRLIASMQEISEASAETQKIVKTIDEIAFQTNLLALNAAVEAARAGDAGAGFAVVADEVRNLAMRAAEAAKDTAALIDDTVKKVREGSQLVSRTNDAFGEVAESTGKATGLVGEIAVASNEQANGIGQLNTSMGEMDSVVQRTAANAEESAAAAEQLSAMASQMEEYVGELLALAGGMTARENKGRSSGRDMPAGAPALKRPPLAGAGKAQAPKKTAPALTGPAVQEKAAPGPGKKQNAAEVIPFGDDDFKDF